MKLEFGDFVKKKNSNFNQAIPDGALGTVVETNAPHSELMEYRVYYQHHGLSGAYPEGEAEVYLEKVNKKVRKTEEVSSEWEIDKL